MRIFRCAPPLPVLWRLPFAPRPHPLLLQLLRPCGWVALSHPLVLLLSPLSRPAASLVVTGSQQSPLRPLWVMELFQLDLHLYLRSLRLRPHPHSAPWRPLFAPRPLPLPRQFCRPCWWAALPHPLVLFLSPLGRLAASLVVAWLQRFPLCPHGVMELFHLDLQLCLRSQWLRPHPHTPARRLRPRCTLPCKPRVHVYTLCIRYYWIVPWYVKMESALYTTRGDGISRPPL